jgi:hypothetical protein
MSERHPIKPIRSISGLLSSSAAPNKNLLTQICLAGRTFASRSIAKQACASTSGLVAGLFFHMLTQLFLNRAVIASGALWCVAGIFTV